MYLIIPNEHKLVYSDVKEKVNDLEIYSTETSSTQNLDISIFINMGVNM